MNNETNTNETLTPMEIIENRIYLLDGCIEILDYVLYEMNATSAQQKFTNIASVAIDELRDINGTIKSAIKQSYAGD